MAPEAEFTHTQSFGLISLFLYHPPVTIAGHPPVDDSSSFIVHLHKAIYCGVVVLISQGGEVDAQSSDKPMQIK